MGIFGGGPSHGSPQDQVDLEHLKERVARLEAAVARLQSQLAATRDDDGEPAFTGANPEDEWLLEVRALKQRGKMINAIKVYREHTGVGLKEAKDAVEAMY